MVAAIAEGDSADSKADPSAEDGAIRHLPRRSATGADGTFSTKGTLMKRSLILAAAAALTLVSLGAGSEAYAADGPDRTARTGVTPAVYTTYVSVQTPPGATGTK